MSPTTRVFVPCTSRSNGQPRTVVVRDRAVESSAPVAEKADPSEQGHLGAPFSGVVTLTVEIGDRVTAGSRVGTIEAMKMEATITAPVDGVVARVLAQGPRQVEGGELLLVLGT